MNAKEYEDMMKSRPWLQAECEPDCPMPQIALCTDFGMVHSVELVLEGERPQSLNAFWAGVHWTKRKKYKDAAKAALLSVVGDQAVMFTKPVVIRFDVYFKSHQQDCSNMCIKPYEDALIGLFIEDDNPKFVKGVELYSHKDKDNPRVVITITEVLE